MERGSTVTVATHYNVQPVFDVFASVQDRDLGGVARESRDFDATSKKILPRGTLDHRARSSRKHEAPHLSVWRPACSLPIVLVYLLMVVNFQSWLDPFIIITALPGALSGILWMLFFDRDHAQRALPHGRDHEHRRGDRQ